MVRINKITFIIGLLIFALFFSFPAAALHNDYDNSDIKKNIVDIIEWKKSQYNNKKSLFKSDFADNAGSDSADWYAIAIGRAGIEDDYFSYITLLENNVENRYLTDKKLDDKKSTEWHRISLALLALGGNPKSVSDKRIDLISDGTYNRAKTVSLSGQGINALAYALITLDTLRYDIPKGAADTRKDIISKILCYQSENGGFSLDGSTSEADVTGFVLQALSPYYNSNEYFNFTRKSDRIKIKLTVRESVDKAVNYLSKVQNEKGNFISFGEESCESTAQVIMALCSLGINPANDSRFIKNSVTLIDSLMSYKGKDGGFYHKKGDKKENSLASYQSLCALISFYRYSNNLRSFYDFRAPMNETLKEKINSLNKNIIDLPITKTRAEMLYKNYFEIPVSERSYIYNFYVLSDAMKRFGVKGRSQKFTENMNLNIKNSIPVNIFDNKGVDTILHFNENDFNEYKSLPDKLTYENYSSVIRLYKKSLKADNSDEIKEIRHSLKLKKEKIESIISEIESINKLISEKLYPIENIGFSDKKLIESLILRAEKLNESDQKRILGLEDLKSQSLKFKNNQRQKVIFIVLLSVALILIIVIVFKFKRKKRENEVMNEEW